MVARLEKLLLQRGRLGDRSKLESALTTARALRTNLTPPDARGVSVVSQFYCRKGGVGRRYAAKWPSLQQIPSWMRADVCAGLLCDLDVVNCHPELLLQLAHRHGADVPALEAYVRAREPTLDAVRRHYGCSREAAKVLFLRMINGQRRKAAFRPPRLKTLKWGGDKQFAAAPGTGGRRP